MSQPPPLPYASAPTPGPRRFSKGAMIGGIAAGFGISAAFWIFGTTASASVMNDPTIGLILTALAIIGGKVGLGLLVNKNSRSRGFMHGIVMSIALVPLVCVGTAVGGFFILCGGQTPNFH